MSPSALRTRLHPHQATPCCPHPRGRRGGGGLPWTLALSLAACSGSDGEPDRYAFAGRGDSGTSVSYSGQVLRWTLIAKLSAEIQAIDAALQAGEAVPAGTVESRLQRYYNFRSDLAGDDALTGLFAVDLPLVQQRFDDIATDKDLRSKVAGMDGGPFDFSTLRGWPAVEIPEPAAGYSASSAVDRLLQSWFGELEARATSWQQGLRPVGPNGQPVPHLYVGADGRDLRQLIEKTLYGALCFSQAAADYLDESTPGSGLLGDHSTLSPDKAYSALEHHWDEAFGYFGAARNLRRLDPSNVADTAIADQDGDGSIDLLQEANFAFARAAAKRDKAATEPVNLSHTVMDSFLRGRHLLDRRRASLSPDDFATLQAERNGALRAWEAVIAATTIHYANEVLQDMESFDSGDYDFAAHAKHWSELKGYALAWQFNPRSVVTSADFDTVHAHIGAAPVLPNADAGTIEAAKIALSALKDLLAGLFAFPRANVGNASGRGGW